jgi:hypothetical protein
MARAIYERVPAHLRLSAPQAPLLCCGLSEPDHWTRTESDWTPGPLAGQPDSCGCGARDSESDPGQSPTVTRSHDSGLRVRRPGVPEGTRVRGMRVTGPGPGPTRLRHLVAAARAGGGGAGGGSLRSESARPGSTASLSLPLRPPGPGPGIIEFGPHLLETP